MLEGTGRLAVNTGILNEYPDGKPENVAYGKPVKLDSDPVAVWTECDSEAPVWRGASTWPGASISRGASVKAVVSDVAVMETAVFGGAEIGRDPEID